MWRCDGSKQRQDLAAAEPPDQASNSPNIQVRSDSRAQPEAARGPIRHNMEGSPIATDIMIKVLPPIAAVALRMTPFALVHYFDVG